MSMNQPAYRRPSWAQHEKSYETYMRNDSVIARSQPNSPDFGPENFSYDPVYVPLWKMPDTVLGTAAFPALLQIEVDEYAHAGAALSTALDRIAALRKQAVERGWPRSKAFAQLSRSGSIGSPAHAESSTGDYSAVASPMMLPVSVSPDKWHPLPLTPPSSADTSAASGIIAPRPTPIAVDSPPVSPRGSCTPVNMPNDAKAVLPDLSKLPSELSPRFSNIPATTFDENSWETYINSYRAELADIRTRALSRWKGAIRNISRMIVEYGNSTEYRVGIASFEAWWNSVKPKFVDYEDRVRGLELPDLEQVKRERAEMGLPL